MRNRLSNGLTWIHAPQSHSPVVAIQVWVKVGSADERPGEFGIAHVHEHMLFKGTQRRGLGEIARTVESKGGEINAWTSFDETVYHTVLASRFFADGLDVLADAVRNSSFDPDELKRETEVVVEEIKRSLDMPTRRLSKALFANAYQVHPYGRPVIGSEESVRSFTRQGILEFYRRHYRPENTVVVVAGDVDEARAGREVEKAFGGSWGGTAEAVLPRAGEPMVTSPRVQVIRDDAKEAHLALSFPIPGIDHPDVAALDALAFILGQAESSRLDVRIKRRRLAHDVRAYAYTPRDAGLFSVELTLRSEQIPQAVPVLLAEIHRLTQELVDPGELTAAQSSVEADAIYQRETVQGLARRLGFFEVEAGGEEGERKYYEEIAALRPAALQAAAQRYFQPQHLVAVAVVPGSGPPFQTDDLADLLQQRPGSLPAREVHTSEIPYEPSLAGVLSARGGSRPVIRHTLPNGVRLLIKQEMGVPLAAIRTVQPGGLLFESPADNGVHQLLSRTQTEGSLKRSPQEIARLTDAMAGSLSAQAGRNSFGLRGEFPSRHFERGFDLLADALTDPSFPAEEVTRAREEQLQQIRTRDDHPSGQVFRLLARSLYGQHPYGLDLQGEEASIASMDSERLHQAHREGLRGGSLVVSVVGDVDPERAIRQVADRLGSLPSGEVPAVARPALSPPPARTTVHRELAKAQTHMAIGFLGARVTDPERHPLELLSSVLSGQGGRLFLQLRDKQSLAYSVSSFSVEGLDRGYFGVYIGTSLEKLDAAANGMLAELQRVIQEPITAEELDRAQQYLVGSHAIGMQKNSSRAAVIAVDESFGLGAENYLAFEDQIMSITREQVLAAAQRVLTLDRACIAVVGPKPPSI